MLKYFICPDGEKIEVSACLKDGGCRLVKRCLTKSTLMALSKQRKWNGIPSITQLIKGTMEAFLLITKDYAESPQDSTFKLLGTTVHKNLEENEFGDSLAEGDLQYVTTDGISMRPDLLETEDGWNILTDYKVSGAYKISKALGMYATLEEDKKYQYKQKTTITNPDTGEKITCLKGDNKMVKVWKRDIRRQDCMDWVRQVNGYRLGIKEMGFEVNEMRIQAIVRDGGLQAATTYGVTEKIYLIPIPTLSDIGIREYFIQKKIALDTALQNDKWAIPCNREESWDGRKCKKYCSVAEFCSTGQALRIQEGWLGEQI